MSAALNGLGHQLLGWLGPLSIELAALALLVLAVGRVTRSPALRHLLWLAVLVKPLVAVVVSSPYTILAPLAPLAEPGWDAIAHERVEHLAALAPGGATTASTSAALTTAGWAALLWLVGATLLTVRILVGFGMLRRMRRQALVQRDGPLFEALRQARAALDCHPRVEVATSPSIRSPMVLGILRLLIVVPTHVVERLSPGQLALVLMHELAHVRRCDNLALLVQRLVTAALFFHPAVWLCARMLRRESEQACDDLVVCATGRPEAYARGLALVAEGAALSNPPARRIPIMSTLAATESDLSQRIRRTLDGRARRSRARRMGTRARVLAVALLFPLAAVTLPSYGAADSWVGDEPAAPGVASALTSTEGTREEKTATDPVEERRTGLVEPRPDSTTEGAVEAMERHWRELIERRIQEVTDSGKPVPEVLLKVLNSQTIIRELAEAELNTGGVRRRIVAVPDSGLSVVVTERSGRLDVVGRRESDLNEALVRAIEQIEVILREGIATIAAESSELTEEELSRRIELLEESLIMVKAAAIDPDAWSDELKAQLLALKPDSTIEEIAEVARDFRAGTGTVVYGFSVRGKNHIGPDSLFLVVDQEGNMRLNDKPVTLANLGDELRNQRSKLDSTSMIIIQSAKGVSRGQIVEIMDIASQAGLVDQVLATEPQRGQ